MSAPYISSLSNIRARTLGPLNAQKTPNTIRVVNNGIVNGTPPHFFSQQEPINATMNSISRAEHLRAQNNTNVKQVYKDTSSSYRIRRLKSKTISNNMKSNSTKNINQNDASSPIRRMRSSGYLAPRKIR